MNTDSNPTTTEASAGAAWLSVRDAAAALCISPRAVQKRAAKGQITARKIGCGAAARWEVDGRELGANRELKDANREPAGREPREPLGTFERESGREPRTAGREPTANQDANRELWREREAELKAEIAFLRNVIEGQQRDAVETRQALKRALDLAPKQLTTGAAQPSATDAQQSARTGAASKHSPTDTRAPQRPAKRDGAPDWNSIYGQIADELEAQELNR